VVVQATYTVPATTADGVQTNIATVTALSPAGLSVTAEDQTTVVTSASVIAQKSDGQDEVIAGAGTVYTYTLTITNTGPSTAQSVSVSDTLPTGFVPGTPVVASQGSCNVNGSTMSCALGDILNGGSATIEIPYTVSASAPPGQATNTAAVTWDDTDPESGTATAVDVTTVVAEAVLALSKVASPDPVIAGELLTYTLEVTNLGPSDSGAVTVSDPLPAGTSLVSGPSPTWNVGPLAAAAITSTTVVVRVDSGYGGSSLANTASASAPEFAAGPITATATVQVETEAQLELAKRATPEAVTAGSGPYLYTLTITNTGPSDADNVVITDTWPVSFTLVSTATNPAGGSCTDVAGGVITCTFTTLPAGNVAQVTLNYTVDSDAPEGPVENFADANSDDTDVPVTDSASVTVSREADLLIEKTADAAQVTAGDGITYTFTITVENSGPSGATGVNVVDTWPITFTLVSSSTTTGSGCALLAGEQVLCQLGDLAPGKLSEIVLEYTVPADAGGGSVTNEAEALANELDPSPDNVASASVTVITSADLTGGKTDGQSTVTAGDGQIYTYTVVVANSGVSLARSVTLTDTWPSGFDRLSVSAGCLDVDGGPDFTCALGEIGPGELVTVTATYSVAAGVTAGDRVNEVTITWADTDPDTANTVTISDTTTVQTSASLSLSKSDGQDEVTAGDLLTYTYAITVTNSGPSLARSVVLTDTWPAGFDRLAVSAGCLDVDSGPDFTCALDEIAAGETVIITATYSVPAGTTGEQVNGVEVTWADSSVSDNLVTASDATAVLTEPDLVVTKSDGTDSVVASETYTFTITVSNTGLSDAAGVVLTDTWPVSYTLVSSSTTGGSCDPLSGQTFTCYLGTLAAGSEPLTITVQYVVSASVTINEVITNTVQVSTTTPGDPDLANNVALDVNTVVEAGVAAPARMLYIAGRRELRTYSI
jgi:large repetitive protein